MNLHRVFATDDDGATAIEYALLASLITIVCLGAFALFGQSVSNKYSYVESNVGGAVSGAS